jgi:hypothetical protein
VKTVGDNQTIIEIERAVEDERLVLSEWESDFIESIKAQATSGRPLSDKQEDVLTRIWERVQ